MDQRPEGVYLHWRTYPADCAITPDNILVIERVNGGGSVSRFQCAREEAVDIWRWLAESLKPGEKYPAGGVGGKR